MKPTSDSTLEQYIAKFNDQILNPIITVIALAAFVLFVVGVFEFIRNADNDEKRRTGQQHMIWGIIGLALLFGARAVVTIIGNIAGVDPFK